MAADIGAKASVVTKWWQRDSIPAEWWSAILGTSVAGEAGLTAKTMTELAARSPGAALAPVEARP